MYSVIYTAHSLKVYTAQLNSCGQLNQITNVKSSVRGGHKELISKRIIMVDRLAFNFVISIEVNDPTGFEFVLIITNVLWV